MWYVISINLLFNLVIISFMNLIKPTSKSFPVALVGKHWTTPRIPQRWPSLHQNSYCVRLPTFVVKVPVKNKAIVMAYSALWIGKTARTTFQCHSAGTTFKDASGPLSETLMSLRFGSCPDVSALTLLCHPGFTRRPSI